MKTIRTLVVSPNAPDTNSIWLYKGTMKYFNNGVWTTLGGVKAGTNIADLNTSADLATVIGTVNGLLAQLRAAGVLIS